MRKYSVGVFLNVIDNNIADWQEQISKIRSLGNVEHLEVLLEYLPRTQEEKNLLVSLLKNYKVIIHAPFMDLSLLSAHPEIIHATKTILRNTISLGNLLSSKLITIHGGRYPHFYTEEQAKHHILSSVNQLSLDSRCPLAIENLSYSGNTQLAYPSTPKQIQQLTKVLPPKPGLTIDVGHLLKDGFNIYDIIQTHKARIYNIHLHDGYKGAAHLQLGKGKIDLKKFLFILDKIEYGRFLTIEVVGVEQIRKSWKVLRDYLGMELQHNAPEY